LQARGQVRCFADGERFGAPTSANLADDDRTRVNADAHRDLGAYARLPTRVQARHGLHDLEGGVPRTARIVLVSVRNPEVDEDAVAQVLHHQAVETPHRVGAVRLMLANEVTKLFRVDARRQRRRSDQIAEHHRYLPAFRDLLSRLERRAALGAELRASRVRMAAACARQERRPTLDAEPPAVLMLLAAARATHSR
jgi:hypothetical protein